MKHRLTISIAFAAVLLTTTAVSPSASFASDFHSEASHTVVGGSQSGEDVMTFNAGTVKCKKTSYVGTASSQTFFSVALAPNFSECTAFGFVGATVDVNLCQYNFHAVDFWGWTGLDISCGSAVTITAFNCWVTIGSQEINGGVTYTNKGSGSGRYIEAAMKISGLKYTQHSKSFPGCSSGTFTNGQIAGLATLVGLGTTAESVGIWHA
jgi:hypothetical protein